MTLAFQVVDGFAPDASEIRQKVITGPLKDFIGPHGEKYTNTSDLQVPHWTPRLEAVVGYPITLLLSGFRLDLKGEFPFNFAHADVACGDTAALLYLNTPEQCRGGTAFFRHLPTDAVRLRDGMTEEEQAVMVSDWSDQKKWMPQSMVGMEFNRLLIYPTKMFHSRFPHEAFGTSPEDGRLIWVAFFNKAND